MKPEFIIHSANTFVVLAENWLIGTGQLRSSKTLKPLENPFSTLREIKHQARNAFKSIAFDPPTQYVLEAREAIKKAKEIFAPEAGKNTYAYEKQPELYWHYGVLSFYVGELMEAKNIFNGKVVPAFHHDLEMMAKVDRTIGIINNKLTFEEQIGLSKITPQTSPHSFVNISRHTPVQK